MKRKQEERERRRETYSHSKTVLKYCESDKERETAETEVEKG